MSVSTPKCPGVGYCVGAFDVGDFVGVFVGVFVVGDAVVGAPVES